MKKIFVFLITVVFIVALLHIGVFIFFNVKGKDLAKVALKDNFGVDSRIGSISLKFPFTVEIKNFSSGDFSFDKADVTIAFYNPFARKLLFNSAYISGLKLAVSRHADGLEIYPFYKNGLKSSGQDNPASNSPDTGGDVAVEPSQDISISINNFSLKNAELIYNDFTLSKPLQVKLSDLALEIKNLVIPEPGRLDLDFSSSYQVNDKYNQDSSIKCKGWIDYSKKDMDLKLSIDSVEYTSLSRYLKKPWQEQQLGVESAQLSLVSDLNSADNEMVIDGSLSLDNIEYTENKEDNNQDMVRTVIALIKGDKERAVFNFKIKTSMDSPRISMSSLGESLKKNIPFSPFLVGQKAVNDTKKVIDGGVDGAKKITTNTVGTAVNVVKEVIETLGESLAPAEPEEAGQDN